MDPYFYVEDFSLLQSNYALYKIKAVRVLCIWEDTDKHRVVLILLDPNRCKMAAFVPEHLWRFYEGRLFVGGVFSIDHFQVEFNYDTWPRFEAYSLLHTDYDIKILYKTILTPKDSTGFPLYPFMSSITIHVNDITRQRMLIDVVGKIKRGNLIAHCAVELYLDDQMGNEIKMILTDAPKAKPYKIAEAILKKKVIYVSNVKLVHLENEDNILVSTYLSRVDFEPVMTEAEDIRHMHY